MTRLKNTQHRYVSDEVGTAALRNMVLRLDGDPHIVSKSARTGWQRIAPEASLKADTSDRLLQEFYDADDRATRLFEIGAGLAVLIVAWPLAFVAMRTWHTGFDGRIALSLLFFVGASLLALVIAVLTVLSQSLRASRAAPTWAPRHD